jgi:hypothetical protein
MIMAANPTKSSTDMSLGNFRKASQGCGRPLAKILFAAIIVVSFFFLVSVPHQYDPVDKTEYYLPVYFAFSNPCESCHDDDDFYAFFLKTIADESDKSLISFNSYNIFRSGKREEFISLSKKWGLDLKSLDLPIFAIGEEWLAGNEAIRTGALDLYKRQKEANLKVRPAWSYSRLPE